MGQLEISMRQSQYLKESTFAAGSRQEAPIPLQVVGVQISPEYQSCYPSSSALEEGQKVPIGDWADKLIDARARQSHILDEIQSQKSEEFEDQEAYRLSSAKNLEFEDCKSEDSFDESIHQVNDFSSSDDDEDKDYRQFMQSLRHMIRLDVEKKIFALIEVEPELKDIDEKLKSDLKIQESAEDHQEEPNPFVEEQKVPGEADQQEEAGIDYSQHIDVYVSMTQEKPVGGISDSQIVMRQSFNNKIKPILTTFKNFFSKKIIPQDK